MWSCLTGSSDYYEKKIMELVQKIKLLESIQNFLPVMPSPILQEMFKQTTLNKITSINFEEIFRYTDSFLGHYKIKLAKH